MTTENFKKALEINDKLISLQSIRTLLESGKVVQIKAEYQGEQQEIFINKEVRKGMISYIDNEMILLKKQIEDI